MAPVELPPAILTPVSSSTTLHTDASLLQQGVQSYVSSSSTMTVALKERKIPTKEEVAAKKRNFNLIFWGGGFVAPFLATIFYFGPKFWLK